MRIFNRHVSNELSAYCQGELSTKDAARVASHLLGCLRCRKELEEIRKGIRLAEQLPQMICPDSIWDGIAVRLVEESDTSVQVKEGKKMIYRGRAIIGAWPLWRWGVAALLAISLSFALFPLMQRYSQDLDSEDRSQFVAVAQGATAGSLQIVDCDGRPQQLCPLKHTDVKAELSGFLARVTVTQEFHNPFSENIEAVYTFPLSQNAAVDSMTMYIGERVVRGEIKRREEAQAIYQAARETGHIASLLEQERPNIFTQSVANIVPGAEVKIVISYIETLKYENGTYEFVYPTVVGKRYIPGSSDLSNHGTDRVVDAARITPTVELESFRSGHDISIELTIDAGVPIQKFESVLHEVSIKPQTPSQVSLRLKKKRAIPNRDFIFRYNVAGNQIEHALLAHRMNEDGFFTLILQPPQRVTVEDVTPKELVFVLDTSGSMAGFPIEKAKEVISLALADMHPQDTFNLIAFSGYTRILFPKPLPATLENIDKAQQFLASQSGDGSTEMMEAIRAALAPTDAQNHIRIVCFLTDGYVGNDMEIISEVQKHPNARIFSFGIGDAVNRFLLDKIAQYGRGEVEYVTLNEDGSAAARRFHERIRNPLLTDISIDWNGLSVIDLCPQQIPDLFDARPIILMGRYSAGGSGIIRLRGKMAGREIVEEFAIELPQFEPQNRVLATLWARKQIDELMSRDYQGLQQAYMREDIREEIIRLGLEYHLVTQFTAFVAVEEKSVTDNGQPARINVPVAPAAGVSSTGERNFYVNETGVIRTPTPEDLRKYGVLPYLSPIPKYYVALPSNVLRTFERGGISRPGVLLPSDIGSPDLEEDPGRLDINGGRLSARGFVTNPRQVLPFDPITGTKVAIDQTDKKVLFSWQPVDGARSYRLQVSSSINFCLDTLVVDQELITANEYVWHNPAEGNYYWRVLSVSEDGLLGWWSNGPGFTVKVRDLEEDIPITITKMIEVNRALLVIEGITKPGVTLTINQNQVQVDTKGNFKATISFPVNVRKLILEALDTNGKRRKIVHLF
ncbi:MAG: VIT domain-containing protein [Acidobacteriota bacterium]